MHVAVLGAGLTGVTTAWYLAHAGHQVTVIDRQPGVALETSFANGGQISVSHPEPWANPHAPGLIARWIGREDAPLLFRLRADWQQWSWGLAFLRECLPSAAKRNTDAIAHLAMYSRECLRELRSEAALEYQHATRGILHTFWSAEDFAEAEPHAAMLRAYGMQARACSAAECEEIEPALRTRADTLHGGLYAPEDETGDAQLFVQELAARCAGLGVTFLQRHGIEALARSGERVTHAVLRDPDGARVDFAADAFAVCLGSYSVELVAPLGERLPIYPVKGYSVTLDLTAQSVAPQVSITDESRRIVCTRLGERLRIAGTAELNGYDTSINTQRCEAILSRARELFPQLAEAGTPRFWAGLRPSTPSNVPIIGAGAAANLWYNTGHGTLGWTLACGSSRALVDLIDGREPQVDFPFRRAAATA